MSIGIKIHDPRQPSENTIYELIGNKGSVHQYWHAYFEEQEEGSPRTVVQLTEVKNKSWDEDFEDETEKAVEALIRRENIDCVLDLDGNIMGELRTVKPEDLTLSRDNS